jgi:hypothetical protein
MHPPTRPLGASSQDRHPPSKIHGLSYRDEERRRLRALAMEKDRLDGLTSNARGRRKKGEEVSEETLISLGGKKVGATIVFGPEGETQLIFEIVTKKRSGKKRPAETYRWEVSLKAKTSRYDTQRELNRSGRGLWDTEKDEPSIAFKAVGQLLACHAEMEPKQEPAPSEAAEGPLYTYPKPELDTLRDELGKVEDQLNAAINYLFMAHDAISLTIEALSKGHGKKVQKAFDLLQRDHWPQDIAKLHESALYLATKFQRPPAKAELKRCHDPSGEQISHLSPSYWIRLGCAGALMPPGSLELR